jgi:heme/copper-type cytochrome/quinol oxidase subunit 2
MNTIPGKPTYFWLEASEADPYLGACAEYCGIQHVCLILD